MDDADGHTARWRAALRRTPVAIWNDDVTDWAAALTYYAVLALFPLLLVILSILGLAVPTAEPEVIDRMAQAAPAASRPLLHSALQQMAEQSSAAWTLIFVGGTGALWSGCSYLSVFRRALYAMQRTDADRPVWRTAPRIIATALVLIALLLTSTLALLLTGSLAGRLGRALSLGTGPQDAWDSLRWPVMAAVAVALVLVLYRSGPAPSRPVGRMAPGGTLAVALLLAGSLGFATYTAHVSTYDRLYGSLAGVVVFLVWLWLSNLSLLVGAQFNAELAKPVREERAGLTGC
ncbi:YihY/virulence factor BrkB family protein [Streptomyces resistomycificus]|uniref:Ribonuclease BN n=1 Tax=Streptomyces resistomycificus TaxID=67356 RepID=A0A0L8KYY5_9ACTN|nr:YihY/virulence factor BrkB family protein [Streptomyces resistomycificus]KOG31122.1 ribonuclease BN [Streptomyces resistomycificus]KUO02106.1 ribonuclease BN [Streptomyces resistomycificus]